MAPTRRAVLGVTAVTIGLAGCTGGNDSPGDGNTGAPETTEGGATTTEATTEATATSGGGTATASVQVADHPDLGEILVDGEGTSLYMFDTDEQGSGSSTCSGDCAEAWPPLTVDGSPSAGDDVSAEITTLERDDGSTQVAADGWPLYYWQNDEEPGDATGQGVNEVWWVLDPAGEPLRDGTMTTTTASDPGGGGAY